MTLSRAAVYLIVFAALNGLIAVITGSLAADGIVKPWHPQEKKL